jgi:hypothetical protein
MTLDFSPHFQRNYRKAPAAVRQAASATCTGMRERQRERYVFARRCGE